jgi:hypothetical protein
MTRIAILILAIGLSGCANMPRDNMTPEQRDRYWAGQQANMNRNFQEQQAGQQRAWGAMSGQYGAQGQYGAPTPAYQPQGPVPNYGAQPLTVPSYMPPPVNPQAVVRCSNTALGVQCY